MPDKTGESVCNGDGLINGNEALPIDGAGVNEAPNDNEGTTEIALPLIWAEDGTGIKSNAISTRSITYSVLGGAIPRKSPKTYDPGRKSYVGHRTATDLLISADIAIAFSSLPPALEVTTKKEL